MLGAESNGTGIHYPKLPGDYFVLSLGICLWPFGRYAHLITGLPPTTFQKLTRLSVLNAHFQKVLHITAAEAAGLSTAYFGAYLICPPTISSWILRRFGFRITFMIGRGHLNNLIKMSHALTQMEYFRFGDYGYRLSPVLAIGHQGLIWRLLWQHVYRWNWPFNPGNCR